MSPTPPTDIIIIIIIIIYAHCGRPGVWLTWVRSLDCINFRKREMHYGVGALVLTTASLWRLINCCSTPLTKFSLDSSLA